MKQYEARHNETCANFPIQCECHEVVTRHLMNAHKASTCPVAMVNCRYCQERMQRRFLRHHHRTNCPEIMVKCPFSAFGCHLRIRRRFVGQHIDDAKVHHSTLQTESHDNIANEVAELREQCQDINFDELRELQNACEDIDFEELQGLQGDIEELQGLHGDVEELHGLQSDVEELQADMESVEERMNTLEESNRVLIGAVGALLDRIKTLERRSRH